MWWELMVSDRQKLSDLAGSASFFVWLFAQSPQLYENYRNSSCEGLSIVFLLQWMAGDATNLIGCILTKQLPFQIAVAIYFCSIDTCILAQYYYYWLRDTRLARQGHTFTGHRPRHARYNSVAAPNMRSSSTQTSFPHERHNGSSSPSASIYRGSSKTGLPYMQRSYESGSSLLHQSARNVADLANEYAQRASRRDAARQERWKRKAREASHQSGIKKQGRSNSVEQEENHGYMKDSILSDSSQGSDGFGYGFGSASTMLESGPKEGILVPPSPTSDIRGRDMTRTAGKLATLSASGSPAEPNNSSIDNPLRHRDGLPMPVITALPFASSMHPPPKRRIASSSTSRRSTKGAGIVLLGMTALFGLNSHTSTRSNDELAPNLSSQFRTLIVPDWDTYNATEKTLHPAISLRMIVDPQSSSIPHHHHHNPPPPPTWDRIVGRISAWICCVLYLTSRLPQIWTNLSRKSVQGLSILLFMAAAMGNALYSISILINPLASGSHRFEYISESLPFLLGSGGTLIFDAIIVMQWIAWRGMAPVLETSHSGTTSTIYYRNSSMAGQNRNVSRQRWTSLERQPLLD